MLVQVMSRLLLTFLVILFAAVAAIGQSKGTRQYRIIPIKVMSEDVEVLYGDPEKVGEPFVIRMQKLPRWHHSSAQTPRR